MSAHAVLLATYVAAAVVLLGALYTAAVDGLDPDKALCNPPLLGVLPPSAALLSRPQAPSPSALPGVHGHSC